MLNIRLPRLDMYLDVMSKNNAAILSKVLPKKKVLELVQRSSRDSARTPVQWSDEKNAGFTNSIPWFYVNRNYKDINVKSQEEDPNSLLNFYRKLLKFRKETPVALYGDYRELMPEDKNFYVYRRSLDGQRLLVICSFSSELLRYDAPEDMELASGTLVLANYEHNFVIANGFTARPYELRVYLFE